MAREGEAERWCLGEAGDTGYALGTPSGAAALLAPLEALEGDELALCAEERSLEADEEDFREDSET